MSARSLGSPRRTLAPLAAVTVAALVFVVLLVLGRFQWPPLESVDHGAAADINHLIAGHHVLVTVAGAVTLLGNTAVLSGVIGAAAVGLALRKRWRLMIPSFSSPSRPPALRCRRSARRNGVSQRCTVRASCPTMPWRPGSPASGAEPRSKSALPDTARRPRAYREPEYPITGGRPRSVAAEGRQAMARPAAVTETTTR
jgi:hypothetical protein